MDRLRGQIAWTDKWTFLQIDGVVFGIDFLYSFPFKLTDFLVLAQKSIFGVFEVSEISCVVDGNVFFEQNYRSTTSPTPQRLAPSL